MKISFATGATVGAGGALALAAFEGVGLPRSAQMADDGLPGKIAHLIEADRFQATMGETLMFVAPPGLEFEVILVVGAGRRDAWDTRAAELFAAHAYKAASASRAETLVIDLGGSSPGIAAHAAFGLRLASYRFDKYRTQKSKASGHKIAAAEIASDEPARVRKLSSDFQGWPMRSVSRAISFQNRLTSFIRRSSPDA